MRAGQAGTALGLGRLGRSSNCSSFIYHQGQDADRTYRAVLIGNHDLPLNWISHPPRVVPSASPIPRYKPLTMHAGGSTALPLNAFTPQRHRYWSSATLAIHSTTLPFNASWTALCVLAVVGGAPCQCFSPRGIPPPTFPFALPIYT